MSSLFPPTLYIGMIDSLCEGMISICQERPAVGRALFKLTHNWSFRSDEEKIETANKAKPTSYGQTRATESHWITPLVEEVAKEMGVPTPNIFLLNSRIYNCASLSDEYSIEFNMPVLKSFDREEIKTIAAHEIKHLYQNHEHQILEDTFKSVAKLAKAYTAPALQISTGAFYGALLMKNKDDLIGGSVRDLESIYRTISESPLEQNAAIASVIATTLVAGAALALGAAYCMSRNHQNEYDADNAGLDVATPEKNLSAEKKLSDRGARKESKIAYKFADKHPKKAKFTEMVNNTKERLGIGSFTHPTGSNRIENLEKEIAKRDELPEASR